MRRVPAVRPGALKPADGPGAAGHAGSVGAGAGARAGAAGRTRRVVLISGAPGAGKSTLAGPLAAELGFALLTKDQIKETLHDALAPGAQWPGAPGGPGSPDRPGFPDGPGSASPAAPDRAALAAGEVSLAWSRWLGGASMELLWMLAGQVPDAVLEANFRPHLACERGRILALGASVVEVNCACPPALAAQRYTARAARGATRHPVHVVTRLTPDLLAEYDQPVGIGQLISVDTTAPVDVAGLARAIRVLLPAALP